MSLLDPCEFTAYDRRHGKEFSGALWDLFRFGRRRRQRLNIVLLISLYHHLSHLSHSLSLY